MRKTFLFTFLLLVVLLAACSGTGDPPTTEPTAVPPTEQPEEPTVMPVVEEVDAEALTTTAWQWVAIADPTQQFSVDNPENYTLEFNEDDTVNIKADCNNAMGSYTVDGGSITIELGPTTLAACPPDSLSEKFLQYLGFAAIYFFEDENLFIDLMADGGTMEFSPYEASAEVSIPIATEFSPNAEPLFATIVLGGGETLWLDPTLVSVRSGTLEGPGVDATTLGEGCSGTIHDPTGRGVQLGGARRSRNAAGFHPQPG